MGSSESNPGLEWDASLEEELTEPPLFKVLLHNDDYTTMEFVVRILKIVFNKNESEAMRIMLSVHENGSGICGIFPGEIAETKVNLVHTLARREGYPLKSSMEEV